MWPAASERGQEEKPRTRSPGPAASSRILLQELHVEVLYLLQHRLQLLHGGQDGHPEMIGAFPLSEAAAGHDANAGLLQQLHAVEHVWGHLMGLQEQGMG